MVSVVFVLGTSGCGGSSSSTSTADAVASCNAWCDKFYSCPDSGYATAADCKADSCDVPSTASASCISASKAYFDCEKAKANVCDELTGCESQALSAASACGA
jgi:hypothetical protein